MDTLQTGDLKANVTNWNHSSLARQIAAESTVLLKNQGYLLPLDVSFITKREERRRKEEGGGGRRGEGFEVEKDRYTEDDSRDWRRCK